jgi:hypothetical protein
MVMVGASAGETVGRAPDPVAAGASVAWAGAEASRTSDRTVAANSFMAVLSRQDRMPGSNVTMTPNRVRMAYTL